MENTIKSKFKFGCIAVLIVVSLVGFGYTLIFEDTPSYIFIGITFFMAATAIQESGVEKIQCLRKPVLAMAIILMVASLFMHLSNITDKLP